MTSWRSRFGWGGGRSGYSTASAPSSSSGPPPHVADSDFTYLTTEDIGPPRRVYDPYKPYPRGRRANLTATTASPAPDIIVLKHRGVTYPLHFPAYSISDGDLTVGDLRDEAARQTGTDDKRRVKLLYKGRILKDDDKACKAEGLKQQSELLCVISEALPADENNNGMDHDDESESGAESSSIHTSGGGGGGGPTVDVDGTIIGGAATSSGGKKKRSHRASKKNKSKRAPTSNDDANNHDHLSPPSDSNAYRPTTASSAGPSRPTTPAAPRTAIEKLDEIASVFYTKLVPQCVQYTAHPPSDTRGRDQEYKRLSETIMAQVILKLDAVETEGDGEARQRRRDLVKETQAMLGRLDRVHGGG